MNSAANPKDVIGGFFLAAVTLCFAGYLGAKLDGSVGGLLVKAFYYGSLVIVAWSTFRWGGIRGFLTVREDGSVSLSNLIRNLVMTAIIWLVLLVVVAPLFAVAFRLGR